jgi:hypothetical protein
MNTMERPLLYISPHATPVIASAGNPALTISPLIFPENVSLSSIPVMVDLDAGEDAAEHEAPVAHNEPPDQQASFVPLDVSNRHSEVPEPVATMMSAPDVSAQTPPQPRFQSPPAQIAWGANTTNQAVLGLPRVLGIPLQVAPVLGENCCEQPQCVRCLPEGPLSEKRRLVYSRFAYFCALNVLTLCVCADVLSSGGRMPWDRSTEPTSPAHFPLGNFLKGYVDGCLHNGMPPNAIIGATVLYTLSALFTLIVTVHILLASRGCILCCAPTSCCGDNICSAGVLLALALVKLVAVLPLYVWLIYWLVQDMQTCAACEYNPLSHTPFSRDSPYPPDLVEQVCVYIHIQCIVRKYNK